MCVCVCVCANVRVSSVGMDRSHTSFPRSSMKHISDSSQSEAYNLGVKQQLRLFWFGEPQFVISIIQFMQFGYALCLAIVLMFWEDLNGDDNHMFGAYWYLVATLVCYAIFVWIVSKVIPQFTLCTSLGYLVNPKHLQATMALHRLEEAQRLQKRKLVQYNCEDDQSIVFMENDDDITDNDNHNDNDSQDGIIILSKEPTLDGGAPLEGRIIAGPSCSSFSSSIDQQQQQHHHSSGRIFPPKTEVLRAPGSPSSKRTTLETSTLLAALVKADTSSLRSQLPEDSREALSSREQRMAERRKSRKKSVSDGVAAMRSMSFGTTASPAALNLLTRSPKHGGGGGGGGSPKDKEGGGKAALNFLKFPHINPTSQAMDDSAVSDSSSRAQRMANRRANRKKSVSASGVIQSWRNPGGGSQSNDQGPLFGKRIPPPPNAAADDSAVGLSREDRIRQRRNNRHKARSESAVIQSWQQDIGDKTSNLSGPLFVLKGGDSLLQQPLFVRKEKSAIPPVDDSEALKAKQRAARMTQRRENRKKAVSASAVIQSWQHDYSIQDFDETTPSPGGGGGGGDLDDIHEQEDEDHQDSPTKENGPASPKLFRDEYSDSHPSPSMEIPTGIDDTPEDNVVDLSEATLLPSQNEDATQHGDNDHEMIGKDTNDDSSTVDTGKSVGELSDVDFITNTRSEHGSEMKANLYHEDETWVVRLGKHLTPTAIEKHVKQYLLSNMYKTITHVFGTLVVFFLIGMRVESMNAVTNAYDPSENTWELNLRASFLWQLIWYIAFISVNLLTLFLFGRSNTKSIGEKTLITSAVLDTFLSGGCLALLCVAEVQRCCEKEFYDEVDADRYLAEYDYDYAVKAYDEKGYGEDGNVTTTDPENCLCQRFGERTYGGLGNIEPFTALIALRVFKFVLARLLVAFLITQGLNKSGAIQETLQFLASTDHSHDHHYGDNHMHGESGTPLELWERAMNKYPEIVKEYGQFSSELFQVMLGLTLIKEAPTAKALVSPTISPSASNQDLQEVALNETNEKKGMSSRPSRIKLNGTQYCDLPSEAQGMILAGKLGKPVKSMQMQDLLHQNTGVSHLPTLIEDEHEDNGNNYNKEVPDKFRPAEFLIDDDQLAKEEESHSMFVAPNARLLRSMRRCDRRLLPILKEWVTVDVVITQFEIVYFEARESDDMEQNQETKTALLALQATKGGKGLRLRDVAAGRKVVGHLDLADVSDIHVERDMPLENFSHLDEVELLSADKEEVSSEYWLDPQVAKARANKSSRKLRWARIKEDRLKLVSIHGSLILRFYSDLDDIESHMDIAAMEQESGILKKDIALQWAQTLVHSCGREQLKQALPHFGEGNSDELRDYLELVHYHEKEIAEDTYKHGMHRRSSSFGSPPPSTGHRRTISADGAQANRKLFRASKSFGDGDDNHGNKSLSKRKLRRAVSSGDSVVSTDLELKLSTKGDVLEAGEKSAGDAKDLENNFV